MFFFNWVDDCVFSPLIGSPWCFCCFTEPLQDATGSCWASIRLQWSESQSSHYVKAALDAGITRWLKVIQSWGQSILSHQFSLLSPTQTIFTMQVLTIFTVHSAKLNFWHVCPLPALYCVLCMHELDQWYWYIIWLVLFSILFVHACIYCILACCDVVIKSTCLFFWNFSQATPLFNLWRQSEVYLCYLAYKGRQEIFSPDGVVVLHTNTRLPQKDIHGIEVRCFFWSS